MSTRALVDAVISRFHLALPTREARSRLHHVVSKRLHQSKEQGLVHCARDAKGGLQTVWFWNTGPSGDELALLGCGALREPAPDTLRSEVGG